MDPRSPEGFWFNSNNLIGLWNLNHEQGTHRNRKRNHINHNNAAHINRGYVHIKFTDTQGGTELGVKLDPTACDLTQAEFDRASGIVQLVGKLTLNYVPVKCIATIDLHTLAGHGHLEAIAETATVAS